MNAAKDRCFSFWMVAFIRGGTHAPDSLSYSRFHGVLYSCVP